MKKLFSLLFVALLATSAWAETPVTFDFTTGYSNAEVVTSASHDGVTITFAKANSGYDPAWYTSGAAIRVYAGGTITVSADVNILGITFTFGSGDNNNAITCDVGTYAEPNWTGEAGEVVFTVGGTTKHRRIASMVVTIDDGGAPVEHVDAPVFTPETGTKFIGSQTVSLTCATEGATIQYAIGDAEYQDYTAPFTITETSTIKAKAVKGEVESSVTTAKYYRLAEVNTIAQANALNNNTDFIFYGNPVVTYRNGGYIYLKDGTGYGLMFGNLVDATITEGMTLNEEWEANFYLFSGMPEYRYPSNVSASDADLVEITATEVALADVDSAMMHQRIMLKGIELTLNNNNLYAGDLQLYNQFGITTMPTDVEGKTFDVEAMVSYHNALQLYPIEITLAGGQPIVTCAAPTLPASQTFTDSVEVTITNNEEGATVYYALNNGEYQEYTGAFTVTETTTVKAYATISGVNSTEVTATYTKVEPAVEQTFALVTDAADLADGDKIILVSAGVAGDAYAMAEAKSNNFNATSVTIAEDLTITTAAANVITLEAQEGGNWVMKANEGYLYAAGATNDKNYLRAKAEIDTLSIASIAIDADTAAATIIFVKATKRNCLRYNVNIQNEVPSPLFSCYNEQSSVMTPAYIYKVQAVPAGLRGDVNMDETVSIADVTALIDYLLSHDASAISLQNADCNLDENISIADVTALIDYLLSKHW